MPDPTINYGFFRPNFNIAPWHDEVNSNFEQLDALIFAFSGIGGVKGAWTNDTIFVQGDRVVDNDDASLWQAKVSHTSAAFPTTFAQDRVANPTFWQRIIQTFQAGWELINVVTPVSQSTINFLDLGDFRMLRLSGMITSADTVGSLMIRTSTNNGVSYDAGATDYNYSWAAHRNNTSGGISTPTNMTGAGEDNAPEVRIGNSIGANGQYSFEALFTDFDQAANCPVFGKFVTFSPGGSVPAAGFFGGNRLNTVARDAFQIVPQTSATLSGNLILEGVRS